MLLLALTDAAWQIEVFSALQTKETNNFYAWVNVCKYQSFDLTVNQNVNSPSLSLYFHFENSFENPSVHQGINQMTDNFQYSYHKSA